MGEFFFVNSEIKDGSKTFFSQGHMKIGEVKKEKEKEKEKKERKKKQEAFKKEVSSVTGVHCHQDTPTNVYPMMVESLYHPESPKGRHRHDTSSFTTQKHHLHCLDTIFFCFSFFSFSFFSRSHEYFFASRLLPSFFGSVPRVSGLEFRAITFFCFFVDKLPVSGFKVVVKDRKKNPQYHGRRCVVVPRVTPVVPRGVEDNMTS